MGSGKGKTRRAQSTEPKSHPQAATCDKDKWYEFINSSQLKNVQVYEYYFKNSEEPDFLDTDADREKVIKELFADFVAVGAITLPSKYDVADFEFKTRPGQDPWNPVVDIFLKGDRNPNTPIQPVRENIMLKSKGYRPPSGIIYPYFEDECMDGKHVLWAIEAMSETANILLKGAK
jgi:hypothetical protein